VTKIVRDKKIQIDGLKNIVDKAYYRVTKKNETWVRQDKRSLESMTANEKRKHPRIKIYHPISFVGMDEDGNIIEQHMGVALDISQGGILVESLQEVESVLLALSAVDSNNEFIEIKGEVAYSNMHPTGKFRTGIRFQSSPAENIQFAKRIVRAYHYQGRKSSKN